MVYSPQDEPSARIYELFGLFELTWPCKKERKKLHADRQSRLNSIKLKSSLQQRMSWLV